MTDNTEIIVPTPVHAFLQVFLFAYNILFFDECHFTKGELFPDRSPSVFFFLLHPGLTSRHFLLPTSWLTYISAVRLRVSSVEAAFLFLGRPGGMLGKKRDKRKLDYFCFVSLGELDPWFDRPLLFFPPGPVPNFSSFSATVPPTSYRFLP
ncbi:hypothetical protein CEXT_407281 [Caerostris extrusa]|uniref:Uncharacterized protein n=1 Tax=Caerostris extrusa TaxID=172846 RepID=A0AAV4NJU7_CAEEX|nr:hypothetical protein CEXT_407281 [Caerostris extrusa]